MNFGMGAMKKCDYIATPPTGLGGVSYMYKNMHLGAQTL